MAKTVAASALVRRELLSTLRSFKAFMLLLLFVALASIFALMNWPDQRSSGSMMLASVLSRGIIEVFSFGFLIGSMLFIPAYAASSIVTERERSTFDFLSLSMIGPLGIVLAKLANSLGLFFIILIGMSPIFCLAFFLIGIDQWQLLEVLALVSATAISSASVGLYVSCYFRKTLTAVIAGYGGVLLMILGPVILGFFVLAIINSLFFTIRSFQGYLEILGTYTFPPMTLIGIFNQFLAGPPISTVLAYHATISLFFLTLTTLRLRRPLPTAKIIHEKPIDDVAELERRKKSFPYYILDPMRRKKSVEDGRNPMMVREIRWGFLNRATLYVRAFYMSFVLYFFLGVIASLDARSLQTMANWSLAQIVVTIVVAPALMANTLTKEYELRNLDMLRMTLLRPRDIILGKLMAGVLAILPLICAALLSAIPMLILGVRNWAMLAMGYGTLAACAVLSLSLSLFASLVTQRTASALGLSYVLSLVAFTGSIVLRAFASYMDSLPMTEDLIAFLSPITAFLYSTQWNGSYSYSRPDLLIGYWSANIAFTLVVSFVLVAISVAIFNRYRMQDR